MADENQVWCMTCRKHTVFDGKPEYQVMNTSKGEKAMIKGVCPLGHKAVKLVKKRVGDE